MIMLSSLSCTPVASISVISVVLSGYRCVPLFVHNPLVYLGLEKTTITKGMTQEIMKAKTLRTISNEHGVDLAHI